MFSRALLQMAGLGDWLQTNRPPHMPPEWRSGLAGHLTLSDEDLTSVTQNHWKRLNTLQHYKVTGGQVLGGGRPPSLDQPGREPSFCSPPHQVPDGATVRLIPQLHKGGAVSQSLAQSCPLGESESCGPHAPICAPELKWAGRSPGLAVCLAWVSPTPRQWASERSRLGRGPGADGGASSSWLGSSGTKGCWAERAPRLPPSLPLFSQAGHPRPVVWESRQGHRTEAGLLRPQTPPCWRMARRAGSTSGTW